MKNKIRVGTVIVGMLFMGHAFAAEPLANTTITATYNGSASGMLGLDSLYQALPGSNVTKIEPNDAVDVEFLTSDSMFGIDLTKSGAVTVFSNTTSPFTGGTYSMTFDFGATLAQPLSGFSLTDTSGVSGGTFSITSGVSDHSLALTFNLGNAATWESFGTVTGQLAFAAAVPEPFAPAMLVAGLGVLGLSRRFSKK